ncbi:MAG: hypothetical protein NTY65_00370 [Planctomycetota bacterium]|nr:hypothetical protein [Planctomycetota bacterium]
MEHMKKVCVFCGKRPVGKTKEHVIPQWLIALTGDPKRRVTFGIDKEGTEEELRFRKFAFDQLTFPSCSECNERFGVLESNAKGVVQTVLGQGALGEGDFGVLLDWLDKVRIGMWLGLVYLDKNFWGIVPKFYIENRIGIHDRMVGIYRADYDRRGLTIVGCNTPGFTFCPSCFSLLINDVIFFNVSMQFLFARRLGFPYPRKGFNCREGIGTSYEMEPGMERKLLPLIKQPFLLEGTELYQALYPMQLEMENMRGMYETEYVRSHSQNASRGIGKIFRQAGRDLTAVGENGGVQWVPAVTRGKDRLCTGIVLQTLEMQEHLMNIGPGLDPELPEEEKRYWDNVLGTCRRYGALGRKEMERDFKRAVALKK